MVGHLLNVQTLKSIHPAENPVLSKVLSRQTLEEA